MLYLSFTIRALITSNKRNGMKKIVLSAIAIGLVGSVNIQAAEDLSSMFSEGKTSGQIREFSISRSIESSAGTDYTRSANAIGGHLKFETADYAGLSLGTAFYTTNGFGLKSDKATNSKVDPSLLGPSNEDYSILGEAYLQYKTGNTVFKGGRQKLDTPMAGSDDARMLPSLFEAYLLINSDLPNTTLIAGHVSKFAQGTFGRAYGAGGVLGATSGYSYADASSQVGSFENMGTYAVGKSTNGVSVVSASYANGNFKAQAWDYFAHDIANIIYADASVSWNCLLTDAVKPFAAAQVISQSALGDKMAGDLSGLYYGAKVGASVGDFTAYAAFSQTSENDAGATGITALENAIVTPWGGMPAFTQGMVTRHMFLAGTTAMKAALVYNFKDLGLKAVGYYATFAMDDNNGYTYGDASEAGFDFIYNTPFVKNLQLRLRGNFATDFNVADVTGATVGWNEYRFIANYNF
jgi:hypothetical protein